MNLIDKLEWETREEEDDMKDKRKPDIGSPSP